MASYFDRSKNYKTLEFSKNRSQLWAKDLNHLKDLLADKAEYGLTSANGWNLQLLDAVGIPYYYTPSVLLPPLTVVPNTGLELSGRYEFELSGATCRYRYRTTPWSAFTPVVLDGETLNEDVAGSGFDMVFRGAGFFSNVFSVVASAVARVRGGNFSYPSVPNTLRVADGEWLINGVVIETVAQGFVGVNDGDIIYLSIAPSTVTYTSDGDLAHYKGDGVFLPNPPEATQLTATFNKITWAGLPSDGTTWIIPLVYCEVAAGVVDPHEFFGNIVTLNSLSQKVDPTAPVNLPKTPSGLSVGYGATQFTDLGVRELNGECEMIMSCTTLRDLANFYEFRVNWDSVPVPAETESFFCKAELGVDPQVVVTGVQSGVLVDVDVRSIDHLGRYSDWSTVVSTTTGGTSTITQNPTFTLEKDFGGFWIKGLTFAAPVVNLQGVSFFVKEGSAPSRSRKDLVRMFKFANEAGELDEFFIPWAGVQPFVITAPFDDKGVHYFSSLAPTGASINLDASVIPTSDSGVTFAASRYSKFENARFIIGSRHSEVASVRIHYDSYSGAITPSAGNFLTEIECPHESNAFYPAVYLPKGARYDLAVVGVDKYGIPQVNYNIFSIDLREEVSGELVVGKNSSSYLTMSNAINDIVSLGLPEATIVLHPGTYNEDITLPSGFPAKLRIKGIGRPKIVGDLDWTNVLPRLSGPTDPPLTPSSPYSHYGLHISGCDLEGRILKSHIPAGGAEQYGLVLQDSSFKFDHATTTLPAISCEQSPAGADNYAVIMFDNVRYTDLETKAYSMELTKSTLGTYASTNFWFKNSTFTDEATSAMVYKDAVDEGTRATAEFRAFVDCDIQHNVVASGFIYECGTGNLLFAHNRFHCGIDGANAPLIGNSGVTVLYGALSTDSTRTADTNCFFDFKFLQEPS